MSHQPPDVPDALCALRRAIRQRFRVDVEYVTLHIPGKPVPMTLYIPPDCSESESPSSQPEPFVPTQLQEAILDALEGKALRTDALANKVGTRSRLFQHPGGLEELKAHGLVAHHKRLGFYRPDTPPDELQPD